MKRSILTTDLSVTGFENLLTQLTELKKDFGKINDKFLNLSLEYLKERAQLHISETVGKTGYIPTGELTGSFEQIREPDIGILRNIAQHAAFVEFGTGVVGAMSPHEIAGELGWVYDKNSHGEAGWRYQDEQGVWHWTKGLEAHRYMYNALMDYLYGGGKEECMRRAMDV